MKALVALVVVNVFSREAIKVDDAARNHRVSNISRIGEPKIFYVSFSFCVRIRESRKCEADSSGHEEKRILFLYF